ncbi:MAG: PilZ domain-containing protein [Gammaproteobacteria bacterium]
METRHSERTDTSLPVMLQSRNGTRVPGVVRNVGRKGLFVKTNQPINVNSEVVITFDLSRESSATRQRIAGIVVHAEQDGVGLYASELDENTHRELIRSTSGADSHNGPCVWYVTRSAV